MGTRDRRLAALHDRRHERRARDRPERLSRRAAHSRHRGREGSAHAQRARMGARRAMGQRVRDHARSAHRSGDGPRRGVGRSDEASPRGAARPVEGSGRCGERDRVRSRHWWRARNGQVLAVRVPVGQHSIGHATTRVAPSAAFMTSASTSARRFSMRLRLWLLALPLTLAPLVVRAQAAPGAAVVAPPAAQQIAAAILPLPAEFRSDAKVLGYSGSTHQLVTLRAGKGPFICLADDPAQKEFHVACYHQSMEPFMARGRALRASGVVGDKVDSARFAEVRAGKLVMPKQAAAMYQLFGAPDAFDAATGKAKAQSLYVVYMPGATTASTGL